VGGARKETGKPRALCAAAAVILSREAFARFGITNLLRSAARASTISIDRVLVKLGASP
jgi:hypothetical protein